MRVGFNFVSNELESNDGQKHKALQVVTGGLCVLGSQNGYLVLPESQEGLNHHHNPTTPYLLLFLFGFLLGFLFSSHKHLLLGFHGRAFRLTGVEN